MLDDDNKSLFEDLIEVEVSFKGSRIIAYKAKNSGGYVCPICKSALFFSESDLLNHIVSHAKGYIERRRDAPTRQFRRKTKH
ncbi:MAG: hypothetical protein F7B11_02420 [Caldisphaeraceae archaeon]|nr:hypothetical protein [Caldisphaeraceae archaeon]